MEDTKAVNQSVDSTVCTVAGKGESVEPGFKDHHMATCHSFVSKIRILTIKISGLFIIELRYPKHFRAVHDPRHMHKEKDDKTVKLAASSLPPLGSELPGLQKLLPQQTGSDPWWGAG